LRFFSSLFYYYYYPSRSVTVVTPLANHNFR
ncbi:MAG: hypothetical protein ACJAWT_001832, partial [Glaciecola sp.]